MDWAIYGELDYAKQKLEINELGTRAQRTAICCFTQSNDNKLCTLNYATEVIELGIEMLKCSKHDSLMLKFKL